MSFKDYLAGTVFVILLLWGPIDHSWSYWLEIRIAYLIIIPLLIWVVLSWLINYLEPSNKVEDNLKRILSGLICITLFIFAIFEAISKTHIGNTQYVTSSYGMEAVGENIVVDGANWGSVFMLIIIALLVLWLGVIKKGVES